MKTAEKAARFFFVLLALAGVILLVLPRMGISVDVVLSGSMEPELLTGSIVLTDTREKEPEKGDIITYRMGDAKVTHRVVGKKNGKYITRGDANEAADAAEVAPSQIIGTVTGSIPFLGYLAVFLRQKTIFTLLILMLLQEFLLSLLQWKGERKRSCAGK